MSASTPERPLSPHWTVYRWAYTMTLSILHRLSGVALALGLIILVWWLAAAATGESAYARTLAMLSLTPVKVILSLGVLGFLFHLCNGVRHLAWDVGLGFERREARRSAWAVITVTVLAAIVCGYLIWHVSLGAP